MRQGPANAAADRGDREEKHGRGKDGALAEAVLNRDFPTAQVITMIIAGVYVVTNFAADVATILATPKLRTGLR